MSGRTALVTGGAQGIGFGIGEALVRAGAAVGLLDLDQGRTEEAAARLVALGGRAVAVSADVTRRDQVRAAAALVAEQLGSLDTLVNCAGIVVFKEFVDHTDDDWDRVLAVCLTGAFIVTQEVLPYLRAAGRGAVVNISSIAAFHYTTVHSSYAAAKAGLVALTRDLAYEFGPLGIRVNAIAPGPIATPLTESQLDEGSRQAWGEVLRVGRWGTPEDIGHATVFLASDRSSFITGQTLSVAGGADLRVMRTSN